MCSAGATTCSSNQCLLDSPVAVDPGEAHASVSGLALLQVSQDLDHHDKKNVHQSARQHPSSKKVPQKSHDNKHQHAKVDSGHHVPSFLSIRSEPRDDAAVSGDLQKGANFKVNSAHEASDGKVWLRLADGRGWVPRDQVSEIEQEHKEHHDHKSYKVHKGDTDHKAHRDLGHKAHRDLGHREGHVSEIQQVQAPKRTTSKLEQDHMYHKDHKDHRDHEARKSHNGEVAEIQRKPAPESVTSHDQKNHRVHKDYKDHKDHKDHIGHGAQVSSIQQAAQPTTSKDHKYHRNHRDHKHHRGHSSQVSAIQQKRGLQSPKRSQEQIREEYKKIPMKEKGLPDLLEHEHGKTINSDWRNEYPYKHDPEPAPTAWYGTAAQHNLRFGIGLSVLAVLVA